MYYNNSDVRLEECQVPSVGPGEALVKVMACGICGSDVLEWYRARTAPRVLGHEMSGDIVEVGEGVTEFAAGDRVFVSHHVPCNSCRYCETGHHTMCDTLRSTNFDPGGFSEFLKAPRINVENGIFKLPDTLSYETGTFIEPLACAVRGQRTASVNKGHEVLVLGSGISGLLHIALAKATGASRIVASDVSDYRLESAADFGADFSLRADMEGFVEESIAANAGRKFHRVIVSTGAPAAMKQALECVDRGGVVLFYAPGGPDFNLSLPFNDFWKNGVTLTTTYGAAPVDIKEAIELLAAGKIPVEKMITHRLPLEDTQKGFQLVADGSESIKVIIEPQR